MNPFDWNAISSATAIPTTATTATTAATSTTYDSSSSTASSGVRAITERLAATTLTTAAPSVPYPVSSHRISTSSRLATCRVPCSLITCMHPHTYAPDSIIGQALMKLAKNLPNDRTLEFVLEGYKGEMDVNDFMSLAIQEGPHVQFLRMIDYASERIIRMVYEKRDKSLVSSVPVGDFSDTSSDRHVTENSSRKRVSFAPSVTSELRSDVRSDTPRADVVFLPPNAFDVSKNYLPLISHLPEECVVAVFLRLISTNQYTLSKYNTVRFVFEVDKSESSTEFMTYATSPDYSIDMIDVRDDMKRMFVYCQKR